MSIKERWSVLKDSFFFRVIKNKYFLVSLFFVVWITFFDTSNLVGLFRVARNIGVQERQKSYYRQEIVSIEEKLQELSSNRDSLEKFAREQYLFKEADEDIFIVE